ncbi:hypothetical protein [Ensifer canadensis]
MQRTFIIVTSEADEKALAYHHPSDRIEFAFNSILQGVVSMARAEMLRVEKERAREAGELLAANDDAIILNAKVKDADTRNAETLAKFAAEQAEREAAAKNGPLTARQLRLGLVNNGFTLAQVAAAIDALQDGADKEKARIEWDYAATFERAHPLISVVAAALGIPAEQIDVMWREAHSL